MWFGMKLEKMGKKSNSIFGFQDIKSEMRRSVHFKLSSGLNAIGFKIEVLKW